MLPPKYCWVQSWSKTIWGDSLKIYSELFLSENVTPKILLGSTLVEREWGACLNMLSQLALSENVMGACLNFFCLKMLFPQNVVGPKPD